MAAESQIKTQADTVVFPTGLSAFPGIENDLFDPTSIMASQMRVALQMNQLVLKGMTDFHKEVHRFIDHRLRAEIGLQNALQKCKTPTEALQTCTSFVEDAMSEYMEEIGALGEVSVKSAGDALSNGKKSKSQPV